MTATYRLQLHAGFTFADAEDVAPYLADLGVDPPLPLAGAAGHARVAARVRRRRPHPCQRRARRPRGAGAARGDRAPARARVWCSTWCPTTWRSSHPRTPPPRCGTCCDTAATPTTPTGSTSTGTRSTAASACRCSGSPSTTSSHRATCTSGRRRASGCCATTTTSSRSPTAPGTATRARTSPPCSPRQHYRLAGWRDSDAVLNYRRFFDVDTLVAIRVEEPDVFEATHALLLDLNHRGLVEGFRIDHPDGLADPGGYLERLRSRLRPGTAIWVEKILEGDEVLPDWACDGTTGYDATRAIATGLAERAIAPALTEAWEAAGGEPSLARVLDESKRLVVADVLVPERRRLLRRAREALPDADPERLAAAVDELLVVVHGLPRLRAPRSGARRAGPAAHRRRVRPRRARPAPTSTTSCSGSPRSRPIRRPRPTRRPRATSRCGCSRPGAR